MPASPSRLLIEPQLDFDAARFLAFRRFSMWLGVAVAAAPLVLLGLSWFVDPASSRRIVAECAWAGAVLALYPAGLAAGAPRRLAAAVLYFGAVTTLAAALRGLENLHAFPAFLWAALYPFIFTPMLSTPFSLPQNSAGSLAMLLLPLALALGGGVKGIPLEEFYVMVLPVVAVMALFKRLTTTVFRTNYASSRQMQEMALRDALTGVLNRRAFMDLASAFLRQAQRSKGKASVLMLDIDHFKRVNDEFGHATGDQVIREVARIAGSNLREADVFARIGGEEFAAFLPDTGTTLALVAAERLRAAIEDAALIVRGSLTPLRVTVSVGVAEARPGVTTLDELLAAADEALYTAKRGGRNRVEAA